MSFMRTRMHEVDYLRPSKTQLGTAAMAVFVAAACLRRLSLAYLDETEELASRFHAAFVIKMRDDDRASKVFSGDLTEPTS
jgi:hypothetical protein